MRRGQNGQRIPEGACARKPGRGWERRAAERMPTRGCVCRRAAGRRGCVCRRAAVRKPTRGCVCRWAAGRKPTRGCVCRRAAGRKPRRGGRIPRRGFDCRRAAGGKLGCSRAAGRGFDCKRAAGGKLGRSRAAGRRQRIMPSSGSRWWCRRRGLRWRCRKRLRCRKCPWPGAVLCSGSRWWWGRRRRRRALSWRRRRRPHRGGTGVNRCLLPPKNFPVHRPAVLLAFVVGLHHPIVGKLGLLAAEVARPGVVAGQGLLPVYDAQRQQAVASALLDEAEALLQVAVSILVVVRRYLVVRRHCGPASRGHSASPRGRGELRLEGAWGASPRGRGAFAESYRGEQRCGASGHRQGFERKTAAAPAKLVLVGSSDSTGNDNP